MPILENPVSPTGTPGVVLRPHEFARHARLEEVAAPAGWTGFVEKLWSVAWDLPDGTTYTSSTAPVPAVNVTYEASSTGREGVDHPGWYVTGVISRRRFDVHICGRGGVVGLKFRPGGLARLTGVDASTLRDTVRPAEQVFPRVDWAEMTERLRGLPTWSSAEQGAEVLGEVLARLPREPVASIDGDRLDRALEVMAQRRDLEVEAVAEAVGVSTRTLQRLFRRQVGVGPKWMLTRARLHDAIAQINAGESGSTASLAVELGWFDQAHFIHDFTALVGVSPRAYRRAAEGDRVPGAAPGDD